MYRSALLLQFLHSYHTTISAIKKEFETNELNQKRCKLTLIEEFPPSSIFSKESEIDLLSLARIRDVQRVIN
jgi:hypothetical protein